MTQTQSNREYARGQSAALRLLEQGQERRDLLAVWQRVDSATDYERGFMSALHNEPHARLEEAVRNRDAAMVKIDAERAAISARRDHLRRHKHFALAMAALAGIGGPFIVLAIRWFQ